MIRISSFNIIARHYHYQPLVLLASSSAPLRLTSTGHILIIFMLCTSQYIQVQSIWGAHLVKWEAPMSDRMGLSLGIELMGSNSMAVLVANLRESAVNLDRPDIVGWSLKSSLLSRSPRWLPGRTLYPFRVLREPKGPILSTLYELIMEICINPWNHVYSTVDSNNPIRSLICTCHDSWAVVACVNIWPDLTVSFRVS